MSDPDFTDEELAELSIGRLPQGPELRRIRAELVELCREHCPYALPNSLSWLQQAQPGQLELPL